MTDAPPRTQPTGLRLDQDLREQLEAAAVRNGRSLTGEITMRLRGSFEAEARAASEGADGAGRTAREPAMRYEAAPMPATLEATQARLLQLFERLQPEQRLALLTLLAM